MLKPHGLSHYSQVCLKLPRSQASSPSPTQDRPIFTCGTVPPKHPRHLAPKFLILGYLSLQKWRTHRIQTSDGCPIHFTCGGYCNCHVETSPGLRDKRRADNGLGARKDPE